MKRLIGFVSVCVGISVFVIMQSFAETKSVGASTFSTDQSFATVYNYPAVFIPDFQYEITTLTDFTIPKDTDIFPANGTAHVHLPFLMRNAGNKKLNYVFVVSIGNKNSVIKTVLPSTGFGNGNTIEMPAVSGYIDIDAAFGPDLTPRPAIITWQQNRKASPGQFVKSTTPKTLFVSYPFSDSNDFHIKVTVEITGGGGTSTNSLETAGSFMEIYAEQ